MRQWACAESGARCCLYVHHTDDERDSVSDRHRTLGGWISDSIKPKLKAGRLLT